MSFVSYSGRKIAVGSRCYIKMNKTHNGSDILHFMMACFIFLRFTFTNMCFHMPALGSYQCKEMLTFSRCLMVFTAFMYLYN